MSYMAKGTLQLRLKVLRWRDYPGPSSGLNVITKVLVRERQKDQSQRRRYKHGKRGQKDRERFEGNTVIALKIEEGAISQGKQAASRS